MTPAHLLRAARRMAGVSQRELAHRAGVGPRTVADIERDAVTPNVATLARLLAAAGAELTLDTALPEPDPRQQQYLRLTLTQRIYLAFGGREHPTFDRSHPPWRQLRALVRQGRVHVVGDAAVGVWTPLVVDTPAVRFWPFASHRAPVSDRLEVLAGGDEPARAAIPVSLPERPVLVLPPHLLALGDASTTHRLALRAAAELLDRESGVDDAWRRPPAHRDVDLSTDLTKVMHTRRFGALPFPAAHEARGWQLGGPVSLAQWLRIRGYPT